MVELLESVTRGAKSIALTGADLAVGAVGIGTGLIAGKYLGKTVEKALVSDVTPTSTTTQQLTAYVVNNAPKVATAFGIAYLVEPKLEGYLAGLASGFKYGLMGDVAIDSIARFTNKGVPTVYLGNSAADLRIQGLLHENSQLKQTVQRLSQAQINPRNEPRPIVNVEQVPKVASSNESPLVRVEHIPHVVEGPSNRPLEKKYEFTPGASPGPGDVYAKRPLEKKYQFSDGNKSITNPEVLVSGFGFLT